MGTKKELTIMERRAIRAYGGWQLANLLIRPDAKPADGGQGGSSNPKGFGQGYWLEYKRAGILISRWEKSFGADRTEKELVVKVPWKKVFDLAAGMDPKLRERIIKVCAQHRKHQSQGFRFRRPLFNGGDREKFEKDTVKFNEKVYFPWLKAGEQITERIDGLLDEAVGSFEGLEAQEALDEVQALMARLAS